MKNQREYCRTELLADIVSKMGRDQGSSLQMATERLISKGSPVSLPNGVESLPLVANGCHISKT